MSYHNQWFSASSSLPRKVTADPRWLVVSLQTLVCFYLAGGVIAGPEDEVIQLPYSKRLHNTQIQQEVGINYF